ncbi:MAG: hypothetical protein NT047_07480 [Deltaproteobacteria bacterium]|nr:hypothetical protein [Deltaproteobacteria bacterium]
MNGNPYGAVPEALKETRLTLRDIMAAHMENKLAEGRLNLEKTKAETETALIAANIKRDELANLRDTAHLNQQAEQFREGQAQQDVQFNKNLTFHDAAQKLAEKGQTEQHEIATGQLGVAKSAEDRAAREEKRKNEERTIGDWMNAAGIHPGLGEFLGVDPNKKIKRADAENFYATIHAAFKSSPAMSLMANGYSLKNELIGMQDKLRTPGLDPAQAAELKKKYDRGLSTFEDLDRLIMAEKVPDQAKIAQAARQSYTDNPELHTKYPDFEKYLTAFQKDVTSARGVFQDDIGKLKGDSALKEITGEKIKVDPDYDQTMSSFSKLISANAKPDMVAAIKAGRIQREAKGDFKGAYDYLNGYAKKLTGGNKLAPSPAAENPSEAARKNLNSMKSAMGVDLRPRAVLQKVGLVKSPAEQLANLERDYKAGVIGATAYEQAKREAEGLMTQGGATRSW